jgi:hypothetical protein
MANEKNSYAPRPDFMPVPGPGTLVFMTVDDVEVATLTFSKPAFGAARPLLTQSGHRGHLHMLTTAPSHASKT